MIPFFSGTPFQLLRFETYQNLDSFLDIVPAYSQYLTGRLCFIFRNENERLFVSISVKLLLLKVLINDKVKFLTNLN